jgi:ABC-2 type transport system ATP-binding protein/lipopolysaccharide transport system ATP-binding protein
MLIASEKKSPLAKIIKPQSDMNVITLDGVSVTYRVPRERIRSLKEYAIRLLKNQVLEEEFTALKNIRLEVKQGEVIGIIGRNGSGKTTLMRVIARVLKPRAGHVIIRGRVIPMLELGAGFHPELTGRENVYLNAAILGHTKQEMKDYLEGIIDFSELHDFIDQPLRTYSSGMVARLGFAVSTAFRPDILLLDEVLGVGDERFQRKCQERINSFRQQGSTFLIVSHGSEFVKQSCDRAIWLDRGKLRMAGDAAPVIDKYQAYIQS